MGILLSEVLNDILMDVPKEKVDSRILRFKKNIRRKRLDKTCPIGVKNLKKYKVNDKDSNSVVSTFEKGAPIHVKSFVTTMTYLLIMVRIKSIKV